MSRSPQLNIDGQDGAVAAGELAVHRLADRSSLLRDLDCSRQSALHSSPPVDLDDGASLKPARDSLKRQIDRLEHELGDILLDAFPYAGASAAAGAEAAKPRGFEDVGPRLLGLAELERERDALVARLSRAKAQLVERGERESASKRLLAAMKLEPGRYKFVRLRAAELGEGGCGVWQVRPRLGLIGMLAGWWQVKLSSGCPLASGRAEARPS